MEIAIIDKVTREVIISLGVEGTDKDIIIKKGYDIKFFPTTQPTFNRDEQGRLILTSDSFIIKGADK